ncbi:MAG: PorV/PorQ family protein [Flavobacteriales bacterium]|nr:PorV/PorQ family protein [Flavobacteriales bacterium]
MSLRILYMLLCGSLIMSTTSGQSQTRKYSNEFLAIGVGARALGMSGTQVALVNDLTSSYWNPAGLLGVEADLQVGAMHAEYFAGIAKYDYAGFAKGLNEDEAIGFSFIRFGVDDIPNTTELIDANGQIDYDRVTRFSAADYAFIFSYARKLGEGLQAGANAKVIHRVVGDFGKSWGFGLDAGVQYHKDQWLLGAMLRDVTTTVNAWSYSLDEATMNAFAITGNEIPTNSTEITLPKLIIGAAREFDINDNLDITAAFDMDVTTDGQRNVLLSADPISVDPHLGVEVGLKDLIYVRAGAGNIQRVKDIEGSEELIFQPNFGIGVRLNNISLDYALTDIGDQSAALYSNIFSLRLDIYKQVN